MHFCFSALESQLTSSPGGSSNLEHSSYVHVDTGMRNRRLDLSELCVKRARAKACHRRDFFLLFCTGTFFSRGSTRQGRRARPVLNTATAGSSAGMRGGGSPKSCSDPARSSIFRMRYDIVILRDPISLPGSTACRNLPARQEKRVLPVVGKISL